MNTPNPQAAREYARVAVQTAPKRKAVYLLHEKCVHLIRQARVYEEKRRELLNRAQNIIAQLQASLIVDDPVSQGLNYLYDYCYLLLERGEDAETTHSLEVMNSLTDTFGALLKSP